MDIKKPWSIICQAMPNEAASLSHVEEKKNHWNNKVLQNHPKSPTDAGYVNAFNAEAKAPQDFHHTVQIVKC